MHLKSFAEIYSIFWTIIKFKNCSAVEKIMTWGPEQPIKYLPEPIQKLYIQEARVLERLLNENRQVVLLYPAPRLTFEGQKIRVPVQSNLDWYRELFALYPYFRRDRSMRALKRIQDKKDHPTSGVKYNFQEVYRSLITMRLVDGYAEDGCPIPPNRMAKRFFSNGKSKTKGKNKAKKSDLEHKIEKCRKETEYVCV